MKNQTTCNHLQFATVLQASRYLLQIGKHPDAKTPDLDPEGLIATANIEYNKRNK